jgi:hypothetical protein
MRLAKRVYVAFVVDPKTGHITHLVLREGHLWGQRDVAIPVNAIERIEPGAG